MGRKARPKVFKVILSQQMPANHSKSSHTSPMLSLGRPVDRVVHRGRPQRNRPRIRASQPVTLQIQ